VNLATKVTVLRIISVFPFVVAVVLLRANGDAPSLLGISPLWSWVLVPVFVLICASDAVDGHLARSRNEVTDLGKMLDPIADKILVIGTLLALNVVGVLPWPITALVAFREVAVTILRRWVKKHQETVIAASTLGKWKTVSQCMFIGFYLAPLGTLPVGFEVTAIVIMVVSLQLSYASAVEYFWRVRTCTRVDPHPRGPSGQAQG
jgi:CDP-diacylglycerol--glycerol-3-phosphate 3-phosphatidyltransferase